MAILNTCPHCSKERVSEGDWPSCKACEPILADYPDVEKIENDHAREICVWAFQIVQKLRCDFLQESVWVGASPKNKVRIDTNGLLTLPSWMSLRPKAMIQMESELIETAKSLPSDWPKKITSLKDIDLNLQAKQYVERFEAFLSNQRTQALNL